MNHTACHAHASEKLDYIPVLLAFLLSAPLMLPMFGISIPFWIQLLLASIVQFGAGYSFYVGTWEGLKRLSVNMDTLVAIGTSAAYGYSIWSYFTGDSHFYFETSALLISFILLGRFLEKKARLRMRKGMQALLKLQPKMATVQIQGNWEEIPVNEVKSGMTVLVRPGGNIPVDGVVVFGASHVDESMLTGESYPVKKFTHSTVYAGTLNQEGALKIKANHVSEATALGRIIRLVKEAESTKAPIQKLADKVIRIFVPVVIAIALFTFLIWWLGLSNAREGLMNAVAVLVISCPCALGLATPTVIIVAIECAARRRILIKDATVLEMAQKIDTVLLDKTGTVTEGKLSCTQAKLIDKEVAENSFNIALGLSILSDHPASKAIANYLRSLRVTELEIQHFVTIAGHGLSGIVKGKKYYLGSLDFLKAMHVDISKFEDKLKDEDAIVVVFGNEHVGLGFFLLRDQIKLYVKEEVAHLHALGLRVHLLTGDRKTIAARVAKDIGVDGFEAEILPEHKAEIVKRLRQEGKIVAMVGDGINDAPALAYADVSFAVNAGTAVALETASVILMGPQLSGISETVKIAREAFKKIRQNLFFAFGYNCLGIPLAAFGFLNPVIAGIAMALSSISVVLNALHLNSKIFSISKPKKA